MLIIWIIPITNGSIMTGHVQTSNYIFYLHNDAPQSQLCEYVNKLEDFLGKRSITESLNEHVNHYSTWRCLNPEYITHETTHICLKEKSISYRMHMSYYRCVILINQSCHRLVIFELKMCLFAQQLFTTVITFVSRGATITC